ncbi:MAG: phosphate ABC transporter permease PstA [Alphaproteobacteria bacterium]
MLDIFRRRARIAIKRIQRNQNPFSFSPGKSPAQKWMLRRRRKERMFRYYGAGAILLSCMFLGVLLWSVIGNGYTAFQRTEILLEIDFSAEVIGEDPKTADYRLLTQNAMREIFPEVEDRHEKFDLYALLSKSAYYKLREMVLADPSLAGKKRMLWLPAASNVDMFIKRHPPDADSALAGYKVDPLQFSWIKRLVAEGRVRTIFNYIFFSGGDSQEPESAGIGGSFIGSMISILLCLVVAFPLGVATAVYLEEFAKENWFTDLIEVNINNLAAVPSIIYGLLGLSVYINMMNMPRSSALVGGLTLALLILPVIVIASRNALRTVPRSIRFAAMAMGATPVQIALHHTVLYALPGIMTGFILSIARALGETSPLLMIGMVAFVTDIPRGITDPATSLPVQIFLWANNPEAGFVENTAAAIIILLMVLAVINVFAAWVRHKYEIKW